jgi:hypothetical protein
LLCSIRHSRASGNDGKGGAAPRVVFNGSGNSLPRPQSWQYQIPCTYVDIYRIAKPIRRLFDGLGSKIS